MTCLHTKKPDNAKMRPTFLHVVPFTEGIVPNERQVFRLEIFLPRAPFRHDATRWICPQGRPPCSSDCYGFLPYSPLGSFVKKQPSARSYF